MWGERGGAEGTGTSLSTSDSEGGGGGRERRGIGGGVGEGEKEGETEGEVVSRGGLRNWSTAQEKRQSAQPHEPQCIMQYVK